MELSYNKKMELLERLVPLLSKSNKNQFLKIADYSVFSDKETIINSYSKDKKLFFILKGVTRGYIITAKGKEKNIYLRADGYFGGDIDHLFNDRIQKFTFKAVGEIHVLLFNFKEFEKLAFSDRNFMEWYIHILKDVANTAFYRVEALTTMSAKERYLSLLNMNPVFIDKVYSKHLADYLGITPVSFSRILKEIKNKKNLPLSSDEV